MKEIQFFWAVIADSMIRAICLLLTIALVLVIIQLIEKWFLVRKEVLKYRKGYRNAIKDSIDTVNELFDEWNADDPYSDIPNQKNIVARLEKLTNASKRNIPKE